MPNAHQALVSLGLLVRSAAFEAIVPESWELKHAEILSWMCDRRDEAVALLMNIDEDSRLRAALQLRRYGSDQWHARSQHWLAFEITNAAALLQESVQDVRSAVACWLATLTDLLRTARNDEIRSILWRIRRLLDNSGTAALDLWVALFERAGTICMAYDETLAASQFARAAIGIDYVASYHIDASSPGNLLSFHSLLNRRLQLGLAVHYSDPQYVESIERVASAMAERAGAEPLTGTWATVSGNTRVLQAAALLRRGGAAGGLRRIEEASVLLADQAEQPMSDYARRKVRLMRAVAESAIGEPREAKRHYTQELRELRSMGLYFTTGADDCLLRPDLIEDSQLLQRRPFLTRPTLFNDLDEVRRLAAPPPSLLGKCMSVAVEQGTDSATATSRPVGQYIADYVTPDAVCTSVQLDSTELQALKDSVTFQVVLDDVARALWIVPNRSQPSKEEASVARRCYEQGCDAVILLGVIFDALNQSRYDRSRLGWGSGDAMRSRIKRVKKWLNGVHPGLGDQLVTRAVNGLATTPRAWSGCRVRAVGRN